MKFKQVEEYEEYKDLMEAIEDALEGDPEIEAEVLLSELNGLFESLTETIKVDIAETLSYMIENRQEKMLSV